MAFQVEELALELIEALQPLVSRIKSRDRALADQLARAASSVALNIGEANYSDPGTGGRGCLRQRSRNAVGASGSRVVAALLGH